jgi:hypothetical protein
MRMLSTALELALMGTMLVVPFIGLFYAWGEWQYTIHKVRLPIWRQAAAVAGLLSVTLQALSFLVLWVPVSWHDAFLRRAVPIEFLLVFPTVLSIFVWKSRTRWWLLASSIFLCMDSFVVVVAEVAY